MRYCRLAMARGVDRQPGSPWCGHCAALARANTAIFSVVKALCGPLITRLRKVVRSITTTEARSEGFGPAVGYTFPEDQQLSKAWARPRSGRKLTGTATRNGAGMTV